MTTKIDGRSKAARALKAAKLKKTTRTKRIPKSKRPPFVVRLGKVNAAGSGFMFEKSAPFIHADEAMAYAQKAIDKDDENLREVIISISPKIDIKDAN